MDGTAADITWCNMHREHVRCVVGEPRPKFEPDVAGNSYFFARGMTQMAWNVLHADRDAPDADWIAIVQPDVVFYHDFVPDVLFDWSRGRPRPVMFGNVVPMFVPCVIVLQLPWFAELMETFPMVVKPSHLEGLRRYIQSVFNTDSLAEAWHLLIVQLHQLSFHLGWTQSATSFMSIESVLGSYLYWFHRDEFVWSIKGGIHTGVSPEHTCPAVHAGFHHSYSLSKVKGKRLTDRKTYLKRSSEVCRMMYAGAKGLTYPPQTPDDELLAERLLAGDTAKWRTTEGRHCMFRSAEAVLETFSKFSMENRTSTSLPSF